MSDFIVTHEPTLRLSFFVGALIAMAAWESFLPRRMRTISRWIRWPSNVGLVALNTVVARLLLPGVAVAVALSGERHSFGLLNAIAFPAWARAAIAIVLLDLAIYAQHLIFHAVPVLWRFHRVHHADLDFDVTTGSRFHTGEILISAAYKIALVFVLGVPAATFIVFEILLNATSSFSHGNARLPPILDRILRAVVVTPDMHRVHHSVLRAETNSNFGFNLSCWDRLFRTYRAEPTKGHATMTIGLDSFRDVADLRLDRMLVQPFIEAPGRYPIWNDGGA